jgi:hypothetical protein
MKKRKKQQLYEVWKDVTTPDGENVFIYIDTFEDPTLAVELCRWHSSYRIKKLGGGIKGGE